VTHFSRDSLQPHQRAVAISSVAGAKEAVDQRLKPFVAQPAVQIDEKLLFLTRTDASFCPPVERLTLDAPARYGMTKLNKRTLI
jgi:hypothetical protein